MQREVTREYTEQLVKQLDPRSVGLITLQERKEFYERVVKGDKTAIQYMGSKASAKTMARNVLPEFLLFITKALGRDPQKDPVTPTEFAMMRRAEMGDVGSHLPTYKMISAYMDWLRHTCRKCGSWIDKDPKQYLIVPCDKCDGGTYPPNTRNFKAQSVRGFLRNTAGTAPFGKGDNFWEWGENVIKKREVSLEDIRRLEQAGNDLQRVLLGGWLCTGMSGDLLRLEVTQELLDQLNQDPLPDVVLIKWKRRKTQGRQEASLRERYAGFVGIWVRHLAAWVRRKQLKVGDPLVPGHNNKPLTQGAAKKAWEELKKKAGIKENGERFTPHVLRAYCFTTMVRIKDHEFARYITGKQCDKSIVTYYNSDKDMVIELLRQAKRYLDPYAAMQEENELLKRKQESIEEKLARLEAESRAKDELLLQLREELRELKRERVANPAAALQGDDPAAAIQELRRIVEEQAEQIKQLQALVLRLANGIVPAPAEG